MRDDTDLTWHFDYKIEQILTDRNISESDPLVKVANITSMLIFRTLQYFVILLILIRFALAWADYWQEHYISPPGTFSHTY